MSSYIGGFSTMDIDEQGRIITIATLPGTLTNVFRFMTDGQMDNLFGTNGVKAVTHGAAQCYPSEIKAAADGKILICGSLKTGVRSAFTLRLLPDGTPDNTFGDAGVIKLVNSSGEDEVTVRMLQLSNGKIINGLRRCTTSFDFGLAFIDANGILDTTLGLQGEVTTMLDNHQYIYCMVQQPDRKVLAVGNDTANMVLVRYDMQEALSQVDFAKGKFSVYPNPARGIVTVTGLPDETCISIYNLSGQKVREAIFSGITLIDLSALEQGIYFMHTLNGTLKIIRE